MKPCVASESLRPDTERDIERSSPFHAEPMPFDKGSAMLHAIDA